MEQLAGELVGRQVGDFRLLELIGEGGMGVAYRAEQTTLRREAVVKVLSTSASSEQGKLRFLREARLASRLDHPYAAHVYAFGAENDGLLWIAMELVRGVPLDRMIRDQGPLPFARFVPLFDRLCEVVLSAHEQGIVHRDIKPSNVMVVRRAGRLFPKLLDFGIASSTDHVVDADSGQAISDTPLDADRSITHVGRVGSPEYMAPEMWLGAQNATRRSDIYALAITAYEMLTGRRPFTAPTLLGVARAHAKADVPPLGGDLPPGLDRVFARALAKKPEQRYDTVLDFDAAIREVARESTATTTADFDEALRDAFVSGGPQPLAEALLGLAAARGQSKAWESAERVIDVLVRVVGVVAIAARAGIGERKLEGDSIALIRSLVQHGLDRDQWTELVGTLVEPFADRIDAHPVPELVAAFGRDGEARRLLGELRELRASADAVETRPVDALVAQVGKVLRACAFLTDYLWVVKADDSGELWMGPRRAPRERRAVSATAPPGSVWLLDRDNVPVVQLSPLVQIGPPSPGAEDEMFFIDGPARRGARCVAWPREFERHDEDLSRYVADRLASLGDRTADADREDVAPYRGLASFGAGDAKMFYGREREVEAVINRLRVQPLIAVVGPSGVGKSSFVHAGVVPALPETWQTLTLRPGALPLVALEARLVAAGLVTSGLADRIRVDPQALASALDEAARREGTTIVLVIDQLEEIFTQCHDGEVRDQLARAIVAIGGAQVDVRVIVTLRDDFLVRAAELPELGGRLAAGLELVTLPAPPALKRILVEPLRHVGYTFESERMPDEMIAEVRERPGALALLSFAASKLWELRDRGFRHIPRRAYESIGGVVGALAKHAEETLAVFPDKDHKLVRELFRHLVTSEGTRATLFRAEAIQLLGKGSDAEHVIETLVERRLVVGYEGDANTEQIEVIHEALLSAWPRLVTWQREDAEGARMRDQVRAAARQWGERGRPKGLLWRGEALLELKLWRSRHGAALTDLEQGFTDASIADETRARRLRRSALATVVVGLAIGLVVLQRANGIARRNAEASERAQLAMLVEQGRTALVGGHPQEAMVYLSEAYARGAEEPNLGFMLAAGKRQLAGQLLLMPSDALVVKTAWITGDGARIVSAEDEGRVRIWSASTGALEHTLQFGYNNRPSMVPVMVDNDTMLTLGPTEAPAVWELATARRRFELPVEPGTFARVSGDGTTIVTLHADEVRTWSARDGTPLRRQPIALNNDRRPTIRSAGDHFAVLAGRRVLVGAMDLLDPPVEIARPDFTAGVANVAVSIDASGKHVAVVRSRDAWLWDTDHPGEPRVLLGHAALVWWAVFSPDGTKIATLSEDHTAKIWDVTTGKSLVSLDGHAGAVASLAWSADGRRIVTGSNDHTVRVWDVATGAPLAVLYGHTDRVNSVQFDRDGSRVITASNDGTVRVFDVRRDVRGFDLGYDGPLTFAAHDARRMLIVGYDSTAWLYDLSARTIVAKVGPFATVPKLPRILRLAAQTYGDLDPTDSLAVIPAATKAVLVRFDDPGRIIELAHTATVTCARFAPDGRIFTGASDGKVRIWSATGKLDRTIVHGSQRIADIVFDHAGTRFAVASGDGVKLYDLDDVDHPRALPSLASATGLAFSRDDTWLAASGDDSIVRVCELSTGALRFGTQGFSAMHGLALSTDERRIVVANREGTVSIHKTTDGRLIGAFGDARIDGWMTGVLALPDEIVTVDDLGQVRFRPALSETRSPELVTRDVACTIPLQLVADRIVPRVLSGCR